MTAFLSDALLASVTAGYVAGLSDKRVLSAILISGRHFQEVGTLRNTWKCNNKQHNHPVPAKHEEEALENTESLENVRHT